ncbi:MAG: efflux RND transporter permease subunit [Leptospiraceae bacterium]|nr:efflux RND transporter permease subunit [Leptospiraceae bacterium]MDW8306184.1 efflux RND transporter permease subunit [Leptospiraceae bacterium]
MKHLIAAFVRRSILANLITVGIIAWGLISLLGIRREAFPNIDFDIVAISTLYPGASPQEVEKLVTYPLEKQIKAVDGIKRSTSSSLEGRSGILITIDPDKKDKKQVVEDIKDAVDRAKTELPEEAEEPIVTEITSSRQPIIELALSSAQVCTQGQEKNCLKENEKPLDEKELRSLAKSLQEELELLPDVASVNRRGFRDREIFVEIFPEKMAYLNISADDIVNQLRLRNINIPGGTINEGQREYAVRTAKEFENLEEIENLILRSNDFGGYIRLKDVAMVRSDFEKRTIIEKANGVSSIVLTVLKKESGDAIRLVEQVMKTTERFQEKAPKSLRIAYMNDLSYYIKRRLNVLIGNVSIGLILVLVSLFLFLGWRTSIMVALGIPFSFAFTFILMSALGITINLISLFGLVIVSGMLVDDAIVIGENIYRYLEQGEEPEKAAIEGTAEMVGPVTTAVTTTMAAFAPLLMVGGIMGKFMWSLPTMVIFALTGSLLESFFVLPSHMNDIYRGIHIHRAEHEKKLETRLYRALVRFYRPVLSWAYDHRYFVLLLTLFAFILSLALIPATGFILFPKSGIEIIFLKAEGPQGISLDEMERRMRPIEEVVAQLPKEELQDFTTRIGIIQENVNDPFTKRGKNYSTLTIYLTPENQRKRKASEIISYLSSKLNPDTPIHLFENFEGKIYELNNKSELKIYDAATGKLREQKLIKGEHPIGASLIKERKSIIVYDGKNTVREFSLQNALETNSFSLSLRSYESPVIFKAEPSGNFGLLYTTLGNFYQIHFEKKEKQKIEAPSGKITFLNFFPSQKVFILSTDNGTIEWYTYQNNKIKKIHVIKSDLALEKNHNQGFYFSERQKRLSYIPTFSYDEERLVIPFFDGSIRIINLNQKQFEDRFFIKDKPAYYAFFAAPEKLIVAYRDEAILYDIRQKKILAREEINGTIQTHLFPFMVGTAGLKIRYDDKTIKVLQKAEKSLEKIEYTQAGGGPPVGAPVQLEIKGDDFTTLRKIADHAKEKLALIDGVYDIRDNWEEGKEEFHVEIDEKRAMTAGITVAQIANSLQTAFEGRVATKIREADEEIEIRVIFPEAMRERLDSLEKVKVRNALGNLVSITELATFSKHPGVAILSHADFRRTIYVRANIDEKRNSSVNVNRQILRELSDYLKNYPGYTVKAGGEFEDTQESMKDLAKAFAVALLFILVILVLQFGNLRHPRVVMVAIPLGIIGVSLTFFFHKLLFFPNLVFSFLASMGIIGLAGVVVNDSIVLIDFINKLRKAGLKKRDAVIAAGIYRLRAVLLTTITTVFGLFPTAYGIGGDDPFLRPMALAMGWGLAFATFITLIVVPIYYSIWEDRGFIFHRAITGKYRRN